MNKNNDQALRPENTHNQKGAINESENPGVERAQHDGIPLPSYEAQGIGNFEVPPDNELTDED